ncbi:ABC transporter ATP-binding protein [Lacticaseibacillus sp. GG6-2]
MPAIFELQAVGFTTDDQPLLTDINLTVAPGEFVTIAGPSGAGKSTLLRLLATLLTPTSGTIIYNGQPQADYDKITYRREVSYCFQQPSLFGETVADNLSFPFTIRKQAFDQQQAEAALASVDLPEAMLSKPITSLSGGEKQRVALIRNLLFPPRVLLLDEVTTGLDAATKGIVHRLIEALNAKKMTIIAVTHDDAEIAAAHRLIQVVGGRLEVAS